MEYEKEKKILCDLKEKITKEEELRKKVFLISDYLNIVSYLHNLNIINGSEEVMKLNNDFNYYNQVLEYQQISYGNEFINNFYFICNLTNNLINLYQKYPLKNINVEYCNPIDIKEGMELLYEFFAHLGDDIYDLFKVMNEEGRISFKPDILSDGEVYDASFSDKPYIILKGDGRHFDYEFISSLAHEIGHSYEMMLNRNNKKIYPHHLLGEVSSLFIQKLFNYFVISFHNYKEKAEHSIMVWQSVLYQKTLVNDFVNKVIQDGNLDGLDYQTGAFEINGSKVFNYINQINSEAIMNNCPTLENYMYVISDIIANNFVSLYYKDPKEALELFKMFLMHDKDISFEEKMKTYGQNLNQTAKVIKKSLNLQQKYNL